MGGKEDVLFVSICPSFLRTHLVLDIGSFPPHLYLIRPSGTTLGSSWPRSTTDTESREAEVYVGRGHEGSVMACCCVDSSLLLVSQSLLLSTSVGSFL